MRQKIPKHPKGNLKQIGCNYFIIKKQKKEDNIFIFRIKFLNDYYNKISIRKIDFIYFIDKLPFIHKIMKEKVYLFLLSEELSNYFKSYNSFIILKYTHENTMNIILINYDKVFKDKIFVSKLESLKAIFFNNVTEEGFFEIEILSEKYNEIISLNHLITDSDKTIVSSNKIGEKVDIISSGIRKIFYCNLIVGNVDFYEIFDISENETEKIVNYFGEIKTLNNQTFILKAIINSYSIYELFFQNYEKSKYFIHKTSKILFFSKFMEYTIYSIQKYNKFGIKLLNENELVLSYKEEKLLLNTNNKFIELENFEEIKIKANNSLVYFLVPLINNTNYFISHGKNGDINNQKDIFIIPEKTNSDIINLVITVTKSDADDIDLYYLEDYNIIPYSRNKAELINKITLKKNKREYILLNNFLQDDKASHLNNEVFYIYLSFEHHISMNYELQYSNYQILEENNQMLVSPGLNKIYIGYENDNYLKFDKCGNSDISFSIFQNEEIIQQNLVITDNKNIISCSKINKEGYLSLEINNPEKFLISLSHENISLLNNFAYNYDIDLSIDENSKNLVINYYPVSNIPQIEYHIFIIDKNYYDNLNDHCFINEHINNIYIKKYLFLSNGEEEILSHRLKITDEIKCNEVYSFLIIAKEIIKDYPNYHYYTPKNFFISEEVCNANNANYTKPYFLLGIDGFKYNIVEQKAVFNLFFATKLGESFPDYIYLYLIINFKN